MTEITNNINYNDVPADNASDHENDTRRCYICDRSVYEILGNNMCTFTYYPKEETSSSSPIIYDLCWDCTIAHFIDMAESSSSEYRKIGRKMLEITRQ